MICFVFRTQYIFDQIRRKNVDFKGVFKKNKMKKEQQRQRKSWVTPGDMIFKLLLVPPGFHGQSSSFVIGIEDVLTYLNPSREEKAAC